MKRCDSVYTYVLFKNLILSFFQECGRNNLPLGPRISGAFNHPELNEVGHWPWMASVGYLDKGNKWQHQCGATLISDRYFLTAAHCANHIE